MGLEITGYRQLTKIGPRDKNDDDQLILYNNTDFPGRFEGLEEDTAYSAAEQFHFHACSYSGYNRWRENLAKLAGYPLTEREQYGEIVHEHAAACWFGATGPFSELINFADNEGAIGPVVSKKLAADFAEWDERAKTHDPDPIMGRYSFYDIYSNFRKVFEMAADNGAVKFS